MPSFREILPRNNVFTFATCGLEHDEGNPLRRNALLARAIRSGAFKVAQNPLKLCRKRMKSLSFSIIRQKLSINL